MLLVGGCCVWLIAVCCWLFVDCFGVIIVDCCLGWFCNSVGYELFFCFNVSFFCLIDWLWSFWMGCWYCCCLGWLCDLNCLFVCLICCLMLVCFVVVDCFGVLIWMVLTGIGLLTAVFDCGFCCLFWIMLMVLRLIYLQYLVLFCCCCWCWIVLLVIGFCFRLYFAFWFALLWFVLLWDVGCCLKLLIDDKGVGLVWFNCWLFWCCFFAWLFVWLMIVLVVLMNANCLMCCIGYWFLVGCFIVWFAIGVVNVICKYSFAFYFLWVVL